VSFRQWFDRLRRAAGKDHAGDALTPPSSSAPDDLRREPAHSAPRPSEEPRQPSRAPAAQTEAVTSHGGGTERDAVDAAAPGEGGLLHALTDSEAKQPLPQEASAGFGVNAEPVRVLDIGSFVTSVCFASDGITLASASLDGIARLWIAKPGGPMTSFAGNSGPLHAAAFSPNGTALATADLAGSVRIWDVRTATFVPSGSPPSGAPLYAVTFSPDGTVVASGGDDNTVTLWDPQTGERLDAISPESGNGVWSLAFSPDGTALAVGWGDGTIHLMDAQTRQLRTMQGQGRCYSVAFSPDGKILASGSMDGTACLWDATAGTRLRALAGAGGPVRSVAFSPDGRVIAAGCEDKTVRLWDARTGRLLQTLTGHGGDVTSVAFSPDGKLLATASYDRTVRLWEVSGVSPWGSEEWLRRLVLEAAAEKDAEGVEPSGIKGSPITEAQVEVERYGGRTTARLLKALRGFHGGVRALTCSPDGKRIAVAAGDRLWLVETESNDARLLSSGIEPICSVAFSPDGCLIASGGSDKMLRLWRVPTGEVVMELAGHGHDVNSVAFSPDGSRLCSGSSNEAVMRVWDAKTGQSLQAHRRQGGVLAAPIVFSPDGGLIASAQQDRTLCLWDVEAGTPLKTLEGHDSWAESLAFSPDGSILASGDATTVRLWDHATGALQTATTLSAPARGLRTQVFSPELDMIATGSDDGCVRLWDTQDGRLLCLLDTGDETHSIAFSPDGSMLVHGGARDEVFLWDIRNLEVEKTRRPGFRKLDFGSAVTAMAVSPDGSMLLTGGANGRLDVRNAITGDLMGTISAIGDERTSAAFAPDGKTAASGASDGRVFLWEEKSADRRLRWFWDHQGAVTSVTFAPDGSSLATGGVDHRVILRDARTGTAMPALRGHEDAVTSLAFSPDSEILASGSRDGTVRLWNARTGVCLRAISVGTKGVSAVLFSRDGALLLTGSADGTIDFWQTETGSVDRYDSGQTGIDVVAIARSPMEDFLAYARGKSIVVDRRDAGAASDPNKERWKVACSVHSSGVERRDSQEPVTAIAAGSDPWFFSAYRDGTILVCWWPGVVFPILSVVQHSEQLQAKEPGTDAPPVSFV
jgi:WD40 repeat protein